MAPNDAKNNDSSNPSDLHIEINAAVLEALLSSPNKALQPLAEMLSGFYARLITRNMPRDLAGACVLKLLESPLIAWIMSDRNRNRNRSSDNNSERGEDE